MKGMRIKNRFKQTFPCNPRALDIHLISLPIILVKGLLDFVRCAAALAGFLLIDPYNAAADDPLAQKASGNKRYFARCQRAPRPAVDTEGGCSGPVCNPMRTDGTMVCFCQVRLLVDVCYIVDATQHVFGHGLPNRKGATPTTKAHGELAVVRHHGAQVPLSPEARRRVSRVV